jgi:hypothetical protein
MDLTKTRTELVNAAAEILEVVGSGQPLDAEDGDTIDARIDPLLAELDARGVATIDFDSDDEMRAEFFSPLSELLANEASLSFGKPKLADPQRESIEERLRIIVRRIQAANATLRVDTALSPGPRFMTAGRWRGGF